MTKPFRLLGLLAVLAIAACSQTGSKDSASGSAPVMPTMTDPATGQPVIAGPVLTGTAPRTPGKSVSASTIGVSAAQSVANLDTTSSAERAQAAAPVAGGQRLGTTVASLGDPSQAGFWMKTPLVSSEIAGRVVNPATGKSANLRLIPLGGPASGGSQVSLPALQLLGVSLTDLPTLEVYSG
ncbi:hypothetical protein [Paracoccus shanxieyensis]|uniref:D-galactarate dehydratase n=1 Tax=Paracoccus shanxieyensis TaxID=2675752 RepID=A0A6L6J0H2_9RHOB|nr:hypothetical protein [Paracoccus shanxieyensis]MTH64334.1 hypothetical protein [Paracoccus shanxieyensis]MTH87673.1 hypothetical protein [Paracoccus shanxieyensis]